MNRSVAKRGGKRPGAGRKRRIKVEGPLPKGLAAKLRAHASTEQRWQKLRDESDPWLRLAVEKYIWDRDEGKPVQFIGGADDRPLQVNVNIRRVGG